MLKFVRSHTEDEKAKAKAKAGIDDDHLPTNKKNGGRNRSFLKGILGIRLTINYM
jgi:hypothetical protein